MTLKTLPNNYHTPTAQEISLLEGRGCSADDWTMVHFSDKNDLRGIRFCHFSGNVAIGAINLTEGDGISNATVADTIIGDHPRIKNVGGELRGLTIGNHVRIENVGRIIAEPGAAYSVGKEISVLDETGSRPVVLYPGLTAQMALLMAMNPEWTEEHFIPLPDALTESLNQPVIGDNVEIIDTRKIINVRIYGGVRIEGAAVLRNGTIVNNAAPGEGFTYIGDGVDACDFIIEDAKVESGVLLRSCYVGQGVILGKRFTAHDSLFFANSACECGEACAILAGPYTVSMHKSSLLIGGLYSFFNAGSGTNSSNHKYKLGPVHWGVMHRGVKTSSDAYVMWGGSIGAFSLLMGAHKKHPDTSHLPFSYIFGTPDGNTVVAPGLMLRSCGLKRDELKWPNRDNRKKYALPLNDNVIFDVLNPFTIQTIIRAIAELQRLADSTPDKDGSYHLNGVKMTRQSIERGIKMYRLAICSYLNADKEINVGDIDVTKQNPQEYDWIDLCGQLIPRSVMEKALQCADPVDAQHFLNRAFAQYRAMEAAWKAGILSCDLKQTPGEIAEGASALERMIEVDRKMYLDSLTEQNKRQSL